MLVRPDYTIFDDIRNAKDFEIFADLRLAGIGMIGVVHATDPVDAIQRFIGKVELGVTPHVIDTIIFIKAGRIEKIYSLNLVVRVPSGMTEADLARPLVEVSDFETGGLEYEIYTYGDQTTVVPVNAQKKSSLQKLASEKIRTEVRKFDPSAEIEFVSDSKIILKVKNELIPKVIGKEGKTIKSLEDRLGISIEVQPMVESIGNEIKFDFNDTGAYIVFSFEKVRRQEREHLRRGRVPVLCDRRPGRPDKGLEGFGDRKGRAESFHEQEGSKDVRVGPAFKYCSSN